MQHGITCLSLPLSSSPPPSPGFLSPCLYDLHTWLLSGAADYQQPPLLPLTLHVRHGQALSQQQQQKKNGSLKLIDISCTDEAIPRTQKQKRHPDECDKSHK